MDDNQFQGSNGQGEYQQTPNQSGGNPYSGYDSQTFETSNTGTYNADPGMYNNTVNTGTTVTSSASDDDVDKKAKNGMIIGIIALALNLIFCCIPFLTDWVFSPGYLFIILEVWGIMTSKEGRKSVNKKGMATAGMVLNIVSLVLSVGLILAVIVLKFVD